MKTPIKRSFGRTMLMFVVLGPPIGGIGLGLIIFGRDVLDGGHLIWGTLTMLPLLAALGFVYGIIPATLTGLMASASSGRIENNRLWLATATTAGIVLSGTTFVFLSREMAIMMSLAGGTAAFVSGVVSLAVRPLREKTDKAKTVTPEKAG